MRDAGGTAGRAGVAAGVSAGPGLLLVQERAQQLVALAVRVGRVLGQLLAGGGDGVVLGALAAADDLLHGAADVDLGELEVAAVEAVAVAALELAPAGDAGVEHAREVDGRGRPCAASDRRRAASSAMPTAPIAPGVGRHHDLALEHRRQRARERRVGGRLALEEHAVEQPALAHHPAAVVAHHRVLQAGEDVLAAEAVAERLGGHVGDEDRAGLPEVGRPVAERGQPPELGDVVHPVGDRLLLEERAGAGAAHAVHVGVDDAAVLDVDELGVLAADLDDREAAAAVRVERRGGRRVGDDLVLHGEARAEVREGGAERRSPRRRGRSR